MTWTNSNLIRRAHLFQSPERIGFNFTLRTFRYEQEERGKEGDREGDKEEERGNMKFIFLPKVPLLKRIKAHTLANKRSKSGEVRGNDGLCEFRGGNWNFVLKII